MDLSARNTFGMRVRCRLYVEITAEADLPALDFAALPQPVFVMGGGSNLLFAGDFPGTILHIAIASEAGLVGTPLTSFAPAPPNLRLGPSPCPCPGVDTSSEASLEGIDGDVVVTVGAGTVFDDFCAWAASEGLWGPENLSLIPGEVGASAVQNIGAYGVEAKDIIVSVHAWDCLERRFVDIPVADCAYGYRTSRFKTQWKGRYIITSVTYRLSVKPQPKLDYGGVRKALEGCPSPLTPAAIRETIIGIRREKLPDPAEMGSAGSFFKNPVISRAHFARIEAIARAEKGPEATVPHFEVGEEIKVPAAWMIDQCGFKGMRLGGAQVYPKQPLVLVNATGDATPDEVLSLRDRIIKAVADKYGVTLSCEVETVAAK